MFAYPLLRTLMMPLSPWATALERAERAMLTGHANADQVWLVREAEEARENKRRRQDWADRFKVLEPRPGDA